MEGGMDGSEVGSVSCDISGPSPLTPSPTDHRIAGRLVSEADAKITDPQAHPILPVGQETSREEGEKVRDGGWVMADKIKG